MGTVSMQLGFEKKSGRITIDGQPSGKSVYSDPDLWRDKRFDPRPRQQSNRQRLMLGSSRASIVWAGMPKPDGKGAK